MKRIILFLSIFIIVPVLLLTGCDKKEKADKTEYKTIEYYDKGYGFKTTFKYEASLKFSDVEYSEDSGKARELEFKNEKLGIDFDMYYTDSGKTLADDVKDSRSDKKYYKEYNFNGYDAYCYGDYDDQLYLIINLKEDKNNVLYNLFISLEAEDTNTVVYDVFNEDTLQDFFNSINFKEV